ncbi:MAG: AraC family transcriptional regulator, partial [Herbinix sp.]|nr:AraC family transcriptional regulator [Herbinix sp.]
MYKLLIADDEKQTREGIAYFIENNSCGFEVVGVAEGGLSALSMAMEKEPDLVLTDIRMPDLNGFELTERLAQLSKKPAILIMSAYDDVEYFKNAFKVNALDYILKPIDTNELLSILDKVRTILDAEKEERHRKEKIRMHMQSNLPIMRAQFFADLLDGVLNDSSQEFAERMDFLQVELGKKDSYCTAVVSIDNKQETYSGINRSAEKILDFGIQNLLEELLELYVDGYVFEYDRGEFVLLMREECSLDTKQPELFPTQIKALMKMLFELLKGSEISATVGVGGYINGIEGLPETFKKAKENVCKRLVLGKNRVIQNHEYEILEDDSLFQTLNAVRTVIAASDQGLLEAAVERYYQSVASSPHLDLLYGIQCSGMLITAVSEYVSTIDDSLKIEKIDILSEYERLGKTETIPEMMELTLAFCFNINHLIRERVVDQNEETVDQIKNIIHKGYQEDITITSIAEQVYLSPNYLCGIFKQITGNTINQYITRIRIQAAKTLLEDNTVKLSEIGNLVGYIEPSYFSKIFKRHT